MEQLLHWLNKAWRRPSMMCGWHVGCSYSNRCIGVSMCLFFLGTYDAFINLKRRGPGQNSGIFLGLSVVVTIGLLLVSGCQATTAIIIDCPMIVLMAWSPCLSCFTTTYRKSMEIRIFFGNQCDCCDTRWQQHWL